MSEFIYVLENSSMPGLVKIGRTERSVSERAYELSSATGVPTGFAVVKEYAVPDSIETERIIHERLSDYRVADNREFFRMEAEDATDIIDSIVGTQQSETQRDFEREDELVARAIPIVVKQGIARPRMLEEMLGISYEEALFVINSLRGRGVVGQKNESQWTAFPRPSPTSQEANPVTVAQTPMIGNYQFPTLDFLQHPDMTIKPTESKEELIANARLMQQTLAQFEIEVALGDITKGPTITRYELHAAPGVQVEEIATHSSNIAAALKAERINILAPIPGKSTVGVDVPNTIKTKVVMRDLLESNEWRNSKARIPLGLGKDVYGHPIIADLGDLPHLLIAGSPGSGKSVCINSIIASLLYRFSPDQLRFVMVDPDGVELQQYNTLPHLVVPVVTDPQKAILALRWAVSEMVKRFQIFMRVGVMHIGSFNSRPKTGSGGSHGEKQTAVSGEEDIIIPEKLSLIVVIIENVENLMQTAKADVELALEHLTRDGRAAGIHLVLTTRQASRTAISETIMAKIPARITFRYESRIESRAVIGEAGAEKLLGKGDMLYLPHFSVKPIRVQGALVTDREIQTVLDFIAAQGKPSCEVEPHNQLSKSGSSYGDEGGVDEDEDIIQQCIEVIRSEKKASVSLLQRRLRLGYGRAARIMDELENRGFVGPSNGAGSRDILIDLDGGINAPPVEEAPIIQPHLVVCKCEHCSGKIEFDANEIGDRPCVSVPCPHCKLETLLSLPGEDGGK